MRNRIRIHKLFFTLGALIITSMLALSGLAQTPPSPQVYWVTVTHVKIGMTDQYEEFVKNETLPAFKKAGGKEWQSYVVATFGTPGEYWFLRPIDNFKQFDEPSFLVKALGEAGARAYFAKRAQMIESTRAFMITSRPALTILMKPNEVPKIGVGARTIVAPSRSAEYEKFVKDNLVPLMGKTNAKGVFVNRVGLGGNPNEYLIFVPFDSFEELGKFQASFGKAVAELKLPTEPTAGIVVNSEWAVYRFLPALSILPAAPAAQK